MNTYNQLFWYLGKMHLRIPYSLVLQCRLTNTPGVFLLTASLCNDHGTAGMRIRNQVTAGKTKFRALLEEGRRTPLSALKALRNIIWESPDPSPFTQGIGPWSPATLPSWKVKTPSQACLLLHGLDFARQG